MAVYVCTVCNWEYDEEKGLPEEGIVPGTKFEDLPKAAREYVEYIEKAVGCRIKYVSVGPERESIIVR